MGRVVLVCTKAAHGSRGSSLALRYLRRAWDGGGGEALSPVGSPSRSQSAGPKGAAPAPGTDFEVGF